MTQTARIDFEVRRSETTCTSVNMEVSKVKPAALENYMSDSEWNGFCKSIDDALAPMNEALSGGARMFIRTCIIMVIAFIAFGAVSLVVIRNVGIGVTFILPICIFLMFVCTMRGQWRRIRQMQNATNNVRRICETYSRNNSPQLSFHLRNDIYHSRFSSGHTRSDTYIEVSISGPPSTPIIPTATAVPYVPDVEIGIAPSPLNPNYNASLNASNGTAAERFAELESIKPYISEEEYNEKRQEILSSF